MGDKRKDQGKKERSREIGKKAATQNVREPKTGGDRAGTSEDQTPDEGTNDYGGMDASNFRKNLGCGG